MTFVNKFIPIRIFNKQKASNFMVFKKFFKSLQLFQKDLKGEILSKDFFYCFNKIVNTQIAIK